MSSKRERQKARRRNRRLREDAWNAHAEGKSAQALKMLRRAVEQSPGNARNWHELGLLQEQVGEGREAETSFLYALELSPRYAAPMARLAERAAARGALVRAIRLQEQVVEILGDEAGEAAERLAEWRRALPETADCEPAPAEYLATTPGLRDITPAPRALADWSRTERYDWAEIEDQLTAHGCCLLPELLSASECAALRALARPPALRGLAEQPAHFAYERFAGPGDLRVLPFTTPPPPPVEQLRSELYGRAAPIANRWNQQLDRSERFPETLEGFLALCHAANQTRAAAALYCYGEGASKPFHRDSPGAVCFPLQLAVTLGPSTAAAGEGAEFLLADERPGRRLRATRLAPGVGDGVLLCTRERLRPIGRVFGLQPVTHSVTPLAGAKRYALALPFHDFF